MKKIIAYRCHENKDDINGYYVICNDWVKEQAEELRYTLGGDGSIANFIAVRVSSMRWQAYTYITKVVLDGEKVAHYNDAKEGQAAMYLCEIMGHECFEAKLAPASEDVEWTKKIEDLDLPCGLFD